MKKDLQHTGKRHRGRPSSLVPDIDAPLSGSDPSEAGIKWGNPKETWGFLRQGNKQSKPVTIAKRFIRVNSQHLGIGDVVFASRKDDTKTNASDTVLEYVGTRRGLGGYHALFRQLIGQTKVPLFRAFVTVHINNKKQVYMCKSRAMPKHILKGMDISHKIKWNEKQAKKHVIEWITEENKTAASKDIPFGKPYPVEKRDLKFRPSKLYYRVGGERPYLCWCIRVSRMPPGGKAKWPIEEWSIHVQADDPKYPWFIKAENDAIVHSSAAFDATGRAYVFDPNPVTALNGHEKLVARELVLTPSLTGRDVQERLKFAPEAAYKRVVLQSLDGSGYLRGKRVRIKTLPGKPGLYRPDGDFRIVARAPGSQHPTGFEEVMAYYHIDTGIEYLEELGYTGDLALFKKPLIANVYATDKDDAWYSGETRQLYFGTGEISECEDAETITHELGHAVQDHICPDFGQTDESSAIGEGFSDYFAMSLYCDKKSPAYRKTVMSWDGLALGLRAGMQPPALRTINKSARVLNYKKFIHKKGTPHVNGTIWAATLWDIYEKIGRDRADKIIIDSHFELSAHTRFSRAARAIVHTNRNLFDGKDETELKKIFSRRGIDCGYVRKRSTSAARQGRAKRSR